MQLFRLENELGQFVGAKRSQTLSFRHRGSDVSVSDILVVADGWDGFRSFDHGQGDPLYRLAMG